MELEPPRRPQHRTSGASSQISFATTNDAPRATASVASLSNKSDNKSSTGSTTRETVRKPSKAEVKDARPRPAKWYVKCSGRLVENTAFISLTTILTIYALTGDDLRVLLTEKPADNYFNGMVLACLAIFTFEIFISVLGKADYWLGFFFILDVVSTATLVLDLTWVNEAAFGGTTNTDTSEEGDTLRSGRTARVGAKAARMIRVLRLVRILKLYKAYYEADRERKRRRQAALQGKNKENDDDEWDEEDVVQADAAVSAEMQHQESTLGKKLSEMTTRRVIILILVMLILMPLLQKDEIDQLPVSTAYGSNIVMNAFQDYFNSNVSMQNASSRAFYQQQMLHFVYYHNWFAGTGLNKYCPYSSTNLSCSSAFWGHLYFVGLRGRNLAAVDAKAAAAQLDLDTVAAFDQASRNGYLASYNYGVMPSQVQTFLSGEWTNNCGTPESPLLGVSLLAEDVNGDVSYPVLCPQDLRATDYSVVIPLWQTRAQRNEWRFEFFFDIRIYNKEVAYFSLATTGIVLVLLLTGSLMFSRDANRLIVNPVEQMIHKVKAIRDNPLIAMKMANEEFKLEEIKKSRLRRQGYFLSAELSEASPAPQPTPKAEPRWFLSEGGEEPSVDYYGEDSDPDDEALQAAHQLREAAVQRAREAGDTEVSAGDALQALMKEAEEEKAPYKEPDETTKRMVQAIAKDDFEECEDALMQGADVNADCGAGMCALHMTALRGEMFLTELLIAHGAKLNQRDLSGNTPLLYACHFYRQHGRGVELCAQLLFHKADPHYRVKDGKLAGKSALELMEKACLEPNTDESVPRQMRAMIQLALDGSETSIEAITKMWISIKSDKKNKKLFQVSSKRDNFEYAVKSVAWELPENVKNTQGYAPVKLDVQATSLMEERFTILQDYLFNDEGEKVKVYITFPEPAVSSLSKKEALEVSFEYQAFDLKLRTGQESYRLRIEPLYGSVEVDQCKYRASESSKKASKEGPMETVILEKTIVKLGSLLALGFGEAGANIISHNMKGSDTAGVNAVVPGLRVDAVIGVCRVLDFSIATEVLQGRIMTFVNQIAEIIHGVADEFYGAPNKNSGEQFLVIWRMDNNAQAFERRRIAEMSIVAFCKILGALHRSALLADYRSHPGLQYRLSRNGQLSSQTRVNLSFGLHAGWAIEGAVGSEFKIDASYVSPNVSIASSVERCTQVYGVSVIVAQSCMELCSPELLAKSRLIDRVLITGSPTPMQLYCVDLDYYSLEVDNSPAPQVPLNTKNRYRARQFIESQKVQKLGKDFQIVMAFEEDPAIHAMRQRYTVDFFQLFNMGYQNYAQGEWLVARRMLMETKDLLGVEDGPSVALLRYMEDPHQFEAPKDWHSMRDLCQPRGRCGNVGTRGTWK
ncbi:PAT24 [Symbiodinium necroappetens]|uniref:PAT24 protein n=1 Tax=Symbiodinium necroappetens TaxID=1628268 RepID=A0A812TZQ3_9DINO|nr:PAT24 [Symbiodinium necroappetens]